LNVEADLKHEKIRHLDLHEFAIVDSGATVRLVIDRLRQERRNCALVMDNGVLVGIFTDRDVLSKVVSDPGMWDKPIDDVMTPKPTVVEPDCPADEALAVMDEGHFRNVPVVDADGKVHGNVSYYAFIKFLADHFPQEVYNLPPDERVHEDRYGG
jgi:CBS domain-containing protein